MDKELAKKDLLAVHLIFRNLKLPLFLMYGTLLGAYRDKDFLDDKDVDVGTFGEENKEKIWTELEKEGFVKREGQKDLAGQTDFLSLHVNRNVPFDIFLFRDSGESYKAFTTEDACCAELPKRFEPKEEIDFCGEKFLIPSPPEEFLTYCYGDFKSKVKKSAR